MNSRNLPGGKERLARNADKLTAICEPIVYKMWQPLRLTALQTSTSCYRESFTLNAPLPKWWETKLNNKLKKTTKEQISS
jgi:hypothetical protein